MSEERSDIRSTEGFDVLDADAKAWLKRLRVVEHGGVRAWVQHEWTPLPDNLRVLEKRLSRRKPLVEVTLACDGIGNSSEWKWRIVPLTPGLAIFWQEGADERTGIRRDVFGVLDRAQLVSSGALLLDSQDYKDCERWTAGGAPFDELATTGLDEIDLYRLLIAHSGLAGRDIVTISRDEVRTFQSEEMTCGFDGIADLLTRTGGTKEPR